MTGTLAVKYLTSIGRWEEQTAAAAKVPRIPPPPPGILCSLFRGRGAAVSCLHEPCPFVADRGFFFRRINQLFNTCRPTTDRAVDRQTQEEYAIRLHTYSHEYTTRRYTNPRLPLPLPTKSTNRPVSALYVGIVCRCTCKCVELVVTGRRLLIVRLV